MRRVLGFFEKTEEIFHDFQLPATGGACLEQLDIEGEDWSSFTMTLNDSAGPARERFLP